MKTISYNDPYELPVFIQIEDDDEEGLEEVINFLNDNAKLVKNADRRERYHTACHLEGLTYEGIRVLKELFAAEDKIGYLGYAFMDGVLTKREAIKSLHLA